MAPVVVPLSAFRFCELPSDKGIRGGLIVPEGKAPVIVKGHGFQNLIALDGFYVGSSFPVLGPTWPEVPFVTKYPVKPGKKVLGYSRPKNRAGKPRNTGLFQGPNRNSPTRISAAFSASVPGSFCGFLRPCTAWSSRLAAPRERRAYRTPHKAWYPVEALHHRWTLPAPGQGEGRSPRNSGSRSPSTISPAYSRSSPEGGTGRSAGFHNEGAELLPATPVLALALLQMAAACTEVGAATPRTGDFFHHSFKGAVREIHSSSSVSSSGSASP